MIEILRFGQGFRQDGANWGERARPYLEQGWRQLEPGIHMLDNAAVRNGFTNRLTVMSDGRARLQVGLNPTVQRLAGQAVDISLLASAITPEPMPLDEVQRVLPVLNLLVTDVQANVPMLTMHEEHVVSLIRLTGVLRYMP